MTRRLVTYIPDYIYDLLEKQANEENRSISNLSAFILEKTVREKYEQMEQKEADTTDNSD